MVIEASLMGTQAFFETDMPFADHPRGVPCGLEFLGERWDLARQTKLGVREAFGPRVVLEAEPMLVHTAHQCRARGRADRMGRIAVRESDATIGDRIDVRSRDVFASIDSDVRVTKVVSEKDDDVGFVSGSRKAEKRKGKKMGGQKNQ